MCCNQIFIRIFVLIKISKNPEAMKVTKLILDQITEDKNLRLKVAMALGVGERNVQELVRRESDNLTKYGAIVCYMEAGFTIEQIIEKE